MIRCLRLCTVFSAMLMVVACSSGPQPATSELPATIPAKAGKPTAQSAHVFVALCDNQYQGIVPVPKAIGNGQDPATNLYWGCAYGVSSFFRKSKSWTLVSKLDRRACADDDRRLERLVFRHKNYNFYLVADAYDGRYIKECTRDFLMSCAGRTEGLQIVGKDTIGTHKSAELLAYIGHDGLMDFSLDDDFSSVDGVQRNAVVLACYSKRYFAPHLQAAKANPVLWTTGLCSPEAYTLHDALDSYVDGMPPKVIQAAAAKAYAKYQKCSERAARQLMVTGY